MTYSSKTWQSATVAAFLSAGLASAPVLAEGSAVSGINGKVSIQGGDMNGKGVSTADGAFSAPLGQSLGLQLDASSGRFLDTN
jgi:hypothetical protein